MPPPSRCSAPLTAAKGSRTRRSPWGTPHPPAHLPTSTSSAGRDANALMESYFHDVVAIVTSLIRGEEIHLSTFYGEESDFVRLNHGRVRQAGAVAMRSLTVDLVRGRRHASGNVSLCSDLALDRVRIARLVEDLRARSMMVPEDPFL